MVIFQKNIENPFANPMISLMGYAAKCLIDSISPNIPMKAPLRFLPIFDSRKHKGISMIFRGFVLNIEPHEQLFRIKK